MAKRSLSARWDRIKDQVTFQDVGKDMLGKVLVALGLGALLARVLAPYAVVLIALGLAFSGVVKFKYWKRFWA